MKPKWSPHPVVKRAWIALCGLNCSARFPGARKPVRTGSAVCGSCVFRRSRRPIASVPGQRASADPLGLAHIGQVAREAAMRS